MPLPRNQAHSTRLKDAWLTLVMTVIAPPLTLILAPVSWLLRQTIGRFDDRYRHCRCSVEELRYNTRVYLRTDGYECCTRCNYQRSLDSNFSNIEIRYNDQRLTVWYGPRSSAVSDIASMMREWRPDIPFGQLRLVELSVAADR